MSEWSSGQRNPQDKLKKKKAAISQGQNSDCCIAGCESAAEWGARSSHANRKTHGAGRQLQELQQQIGLDVRVRHGGKPALQGRPRHPGEGAGEGERRLRARSLRKLLNSLLRHVNALSVAYLSFSSQLWLDSVPFVIRAPPNWYHKLVLSGKRN